MVVYLQDRESDVVDLVIKVDQVVDNKVLGKQRENRVRLVLRMDANDLKHVELGKDTLQDLRLARAVFNVAVLLRLLLRGIVRVVGPFMVSQIRTCTVTGGLFLIAAVLLQQIERLVPEEPLVELQFAHLGLKLHEFQKPDEPIHGQRLPVQDKLAIELHRNGHVLIFVSAPGSIAADNADTHPLVTLH